MQSTRNPSRILFFILILVVALVLYLVADPQVLLDLRSGSLSAATWSHSTLIWFLKTYGYYIGFAYAALVGVLLFFENRNPDRTLAWLLVLGIFPVIGIVLYWVVGPRFRYIADKRRIRHVRSRKTSAALTESVVLEHDLADAVASVIYGCSREQVCLDSSVQVFHDGAELFSVMLQDIAKAQHCILLESYILRNDTIGNQFKEALMERAQGGVTVCVLYDAVGSWNIGSSFVADLRRAGVIAHPFLPVSFPMFRGANYRNHRKILVVDNEKAFIGGFNIGDEYTGKSKKWTHWRDTHVALAGTIVQRISTLFMQDVGLCGLDAQRVNTLKVRMGDLAHKERGQRGSHTFTENPAKETLFPITPVAGQIAYSGPDAPWDTILHAYLGLISRAKKRVWITTPYLVPGDALLKILSTTALSGVDVRLVVPEKADSLIVQWASFHVLEELLRAGVRVYLYPKKRFMHSKTMTCDGQVYVAGSANLDTRSLHINFEIQGFFYDSRLARVGEKTFLQDIAVARELELALWLKRPLYQRFQENVGKLFSSLA